MLSEQRRKVAVEALNRARGQSSTRNDILVMMEFEKLGYQDVRPRENVLTYAAWLAVGRHVRSGEHGVPIETWVPIPLKKEAQMDLALGEEPKKKLRRKIAVLFHRDQTDPLEGSK